MLLLIAIGSSIPTAEFVRASIVTDGEIVELQRVRSRPSTKAGYKPLFRFTANNGQTYTILANSATSLVPFKRGDQIRVLYIEGHPETARIDTFAQLWLPQVILGFFGAVFTAVPVRIQMRKRALDRAALIR